jgi:tRNA(adenine34) deaminase
MISQAENPHLHFMREAFKEAMLALQKDEVPIGAVVVCRNKIIGRGHNLTEQLNDVTAHAEMQAITAAANYLGGKYLDECTLYVTIEPCVMCAGASQWAHLGHLVYGASDDKKGYSKITGTILHPKTAVTKGVLEKECSELLKEFFRQKR